MQLNEFQKSFKDLMLDHPKALDEPPEELAAYCAEGDIPLPARLKVYRNNIVGSLTDVMLATFPILEKLVGKEFLEGMARTFILQNPPSQGCLSLYGEGFAEFIDSFDPAKPLPYLPDVARYELALNKAYYAKDDDALTAEGIATIPPEQLGDIKLNLRDHVQILQSRYPLTAIQAFCMTGEQDGTLDLDQGGEMLMVYRARLDTQTSILEPGECLMLKSLSEGKMLGEAVEAVMNTHEDFDFQSFLQKHLALETFMALPANS